MVDNHKAKPFKALTVYGVIVQTFKSSRDKSALDFLGISQSLISKRLNSSDYGLFFRVDNHPEPIALVYLNETLEEKALRTDRYIGIDYSSVVRFVTEITVKHKDGRIVELKNYSTYSEAGKMLGFATPIELRSISNLIQGLIISCYGWKVVK